jgi:hypothetical protein
VWGLLALAVGWVVLVRVPLVANAPVHLDSDLAVDGLTLVDALNGTWRWHYPGTPHMGTAPVVLSLPQAAVFGATPETLVSGGVVAYALLVLATFWLAWELGGRGAAMWALVPLAFSSTGLIWLSGRITGGHLLTAAWHAAAFAGLARLLARGGAWRAALLGIWCGLGLWVDRLFLFSLLGIVPAILTRVLERRVWRRRLVEGLIFAVGVVLGHVPGPWGQRVDPYDAYGSQFETILVDPARRRVDWEAARGLAVEHAKILALQCAPRLFAGQRPAWDRVGRFAGLASDPSPELFGGRPRRRDLIDNGVVPWAALAVGLAGVGMAVVGLLGRGDGEDVGPALVRGGLIAAGLLTLAGFLLNRNIYDSDNYRYLVTWIPGWAAGLGMGLDRIARGRRGRWVAIGFAGLLAVVMTLDTIRWYGRLGWMDGIVPARARLEDPALEWLARHPEIDGIYGGYWDVYRLAFLRGGGMKAVPYPEYPVRFPEWRDAYPGDRPRTLLARPDGLGTFNRAKALSEGGRVVEEGADLSVVDWPNG